MADQSRFGPPQRGAFLTRESVSAIVSLRESVSADVSLRERVSADGSLRQCAWCWLVQDATGTYRTQPGRKIKAATHGICPGCKETMRAEIDGRSIVLVRAA